jgi:acyl carrier protein
MNEVKSRIRQFIVGNFLFGQDNGLADEASFLEQGLIDSTGVLELVGFLEKEFAIKVEDHELVPDNLDSVNSVAAYLEKKLAPKA